MPQEMLIFQGIVSRRTMMSIENIRNEQGKLVADVVVVYPDIVIYPNPKIVNITGAKMTFDGGPRIDTYFLIGMRRENACYVGKSAADEIEKSLMDMIRNSGQYEYVYRNDQVVVVRLSWIPIQLNGVTVPALTPT
jgi:hypothetical protein